MQLAVNKEADIRQFINAFISKFCLSKISNNNVNNMIIKMIGPLNMIYLSYLLEKTYHINFNDEDYDNINFYTVDGLTRIIINKLLNEC